LTLLSETTLCDDFEQQTALLAAARGQRAHVHGQLLDAAFKGAMFSAATIGAAFGGGLPPAAVLSVGLAGLGAMGVAQSARTFGAIKAASREPSLSAAGLASTAFGVLLLAGLVPLTAYLLAGERAGASAIAVACVFFAIGSLRKWEAPTEWWQGGLNGLLLGLTVGALSFGIGHTAELLIATSRG
jgi:hypothetical protein